MHFSTILINTALIAASSTIAYNPCPAHTYPKCCGFDVLDLADLDCNTPRVSLTSLGLFTDTCAQQGKEPKCCAIPIVGQALFCVHPIASPDPPPAAPNDQRPLGGVPATKATPSPAMKDSPGNGKPVNNESYEPCITGPYSEAKCCATDVLGVADLNCEAPQFTPRSAMDFSAICAKRGTQAACCALPLLGQAELCVKPVGT